MIRFTWMTRRLLLGVLAGALLLGGSLIDARGAMAGFGSSPGSPGSSTLAKSCTSGDHFKKVTLVV